MKQKHINLLRAAANLLQSSMIQDENITELKKERNNALLKKDIAKVHSINWMLEFAKERNKEFLLDYAGTIQQVAETNFMKLIAENEVHPLVNDIINSHFPVV